ncbi:MAG: hypothetical protein ACLFR1_02305 [Spirochaetia bacterium]
MKKTIFISDNGSDFAPILTNTLLDKGCQVASATPPESSSVPLSGSEDQVLTLPWRQNTPVGAKNLLLEGLNKFHSFDYAALIFQPSRKSSAFHELGPRDIEETIDKEVNAQLHIAREILRYFQRKKKGSLFFLFPDVHGNVFSPIHSATLGCMESLIDSLFTFYQKEPIFLSGIYFESSSSEEAAKFIADAIQNQTEKIRNKWIKYTGKTHFFSPFEVINRKK